jgi:MFS family permease
VGFSEVAKSKAPLRELFANHRGGLVVGSALRLAEMCGSHLVTTFALAYGGLVHASAQVLVLSVGVAMLIDSIMMVVFGALSDRIGRRPICLAGIVGIGLAVYPLFRAIAGGHTVPTMAMMILASGFCHAAMVGVQPCLLADLFPTRIRASGVAIVQAASAIIAGCVPLVAMILFRHYLSVTPVVILMAVLCVFSAAALSQIRRFGGHLDTPAL